jgi:hypothetical protein
MNPPAAVFARNQNLKCWQWCCASAGGARSSQFGHVPKWNHRRKIGDPVLAISCKRMRRFNEGRWVERKRRKNG